MNRFRKSLAVLLSLLMLISLFAVSATISVSAAPQDKETVIVAMSDYQPKDTLGPQRLDSLIASLKANGIVSADRIFTVGDYSGEYTLEASTAGVNLLKDKFSGLADTSDMVFTQGNHDLITVPGLTLEGNHDPAYGDYGLYVIDEDNYAEWGSYNAASVAALQAYLTNKVDIGFSKPIFILNHIPLHWGNRTIADGSSTHGGVFFDVINNAGAQGLNIIYLFGHNHSSGYDDFLGGSCIFLKKGDTMQVCRGTKRESTTETLNFTYMNAGYVGYYSSDEATSEKTLTASVFRIRGNEVIISRYSADGQYNLKSAGVANAKFADGNRPTVNPTVYTGSYKIAADGTATPVDSVHEMSDNNGVFTAAQTSSSEDVSGLAFRFDVATAGMAVNETTAIYDAATVNTLDGNDYKLVGMGAIVTNNPNVGNDGSAFYLDRVDGKKVIDVPAVYLCDLEDTSAAFTVRIRNIPETNYDSAIYARPYFVFDLNGTEITVYGDIVGASYNGKLSENDGELEW